MAYKGGEYEPPPARQVGTGTLLHLEEELRFARRVLAVTLVLTALLFAAVAVFLALGLREQDDLKDNQRRALEVIGQSQTLDCNARKELAGAAGVPAPAGKAGNCEAIQRQYDHLASKAD